ncbi:MAG: CRTAC1 family protein [Salinibacter sp.]|uniref:CRTAC1 family protein n=1 Tax=Salinibacter sp. TaxID=2065818 RepID=UPI0035D3E1EF
MSRLPPPFARSLILGLLAAFAVGCQSGTDSGASSNVEPPIQADTIAGTETEKMRRVLAALNEQAYAHPMEYFHLNGRRAEVFKKRLDEAASAKKKNKLRYQYAYELLYAGQVKESIRQLNTLIQTENLRLPQMSRRTKPIYNLLGLAYLRLGEQQNCIKHHSSQSCILPIRGAGVHTNKTGSQNAAEIYKTMAQQYPGDLEPRWLYNVAHMTLGQYPDEIPYGRLRIPGIEATDDGPIKQFREVASPLGVNHNAIAGGVSVEDFNNDGFLDIFATSYGLDDEPRLYMNDGEGGFVDRTEEAGLTGLVGGLNTVHADYNNDGYEDIFILRGAWLGEQGRRPNSLLRNNGDGTFTDVTYKAGLDAYHPTQTAAWADVNNDGHVDLFVGNESDAELDPFSGDTTGTTSTPHPSTLYLNQGNGTFVERAAEAGIDLKTYVKGSAWGDVNGDGLPDLYASVLGGPNRLYVNQGPSANGLPQFEERAKEAGVRAPIFSFPVWFWDYNNDGHDDLFVSGYDMRYFQRVAHAVAAEYLGANLQVETPRVYRNDGDGTFTEVSRTLNLDKVLFTMGSNYGDLDNDGYQDFYAGTGSPDFSSIVPNRMFHNQDGARFEEVSFKGGFAHIQKGHAVAFADFDRDGDQDIYSVMGGAVPGDSYPNVLFENPGHGHNWVTLDLRGRTANRSAIGARIKITARRPDGTRRTIYRTVRTGGSFGAAALQQEIGLGEATRIDTLRVTWPTAKSNTQTFTGLSVNKTYRLVEGKTPTPLDRPTVPFRVP